MMTPRDPDPPTPLERFTVLDTFSGGLVRPLERIEALATISAGYREAAPDGRLGRPAVSRDGRIHVHGDPERVPGLIRALQARQFKSLLVAFPFDDPALFIQQRYAEYSATALLAYGDERGITRIVNGEHRFSPPDSDEFKEALQRVKVQTSVYFCLAEWGPDGPDVVFPDGLGFYRLRMTSRNSVRSILNSLKEVARFTRGRIAGIPFDLFLDYQDVVGPDGTRRMVPVWRIVMRPPEGVRLSAANFALVAQRSIEAASRLMLPAPRQETLHDALAEPPEPDLDELAVTPPSEEEAELLARGGRCDAAYWRGRWFSELRGYPLGDDEESRSRWIAHWTGGRYHSLAEALARMTDAEAAELFEAAVQAKRADEHGRKPGLRVPPEALERQRQWEEEARALAERHRERMAQRLAAEAVPEPEPEPDGQALNADERAESDALYLGLRAMVDQAEDPAALEQATAEIVSVKHLLTDDQRSDLRDRVGMARERLGLEPARRRARS